MINKKLYSSLTSSQVTNRKIGFFSSAAVVNNDYHKRLCYTQT